MNNAELDANLTAIATFLAEMIALYGDDVLATVNACNNTPNATEKGVK